MRKTSAIRRLAIDSFDAIRNGHAMTAMCEFDVTEARRRLRALRRRGGKSSFFAFMLKTIAMTLSENRELNSIRGKGRVVEFQDVDVNFPVEMDKENGRPPRQVTIRGASEKTLEEIAGEIEAARESHRATGAAGGEDQKTLKLMKGMLLVPKFLRILIIRALTRDPFLVKKMSGTTMVTSVGTFGATPGFILPFMGGPRAVSFVLGNVVRRPVVVARDVQVREIMSMTLVFNHDIVDGAPAARFVEKLRKNIEKAECLGALPEWNNGTQ